MAEELALDQVLGNGRAIDFDKRAVAPAAEGVNGPRHQLLARAVLAINQDAAVGRRRHRHLLAQLPDRVALAHHRLVTVHAGAQREVFHFEPPLTERIAHHQHGFLQRQRLLDEVEGAQLDCADRRFDVAMARDQHDLRIDLPLADPGERGQAIHAGQPDVEHDEVDGAPRNAIEALLSRRDRFDGVPLVTEHARQRRSDARFVVDDEDRWFHGALGFRL